MVIRYNLIIEIVKIGYTEGFRRINSMPLCRPYIQISSPKNYTSLTRPADANKKGALWAPLISLTN